jgi:hypothetical protein
MTYKPPTPPPVRHDAGIGDHLGPRRVVGECEIHDGTSVVATCETTGAAPGFLTDTTGVPQQRVPDLVIDQKSTQPALRRVGTGRYRQQPPIGRSISSL